MRRIYCFAAVIILSVTLMVISYAFDSANANNSTEPDSEFIESMFGSWENELTQVMSIIEINRTEIDTSKSTYSADNAYKVCITENMLVTEYQKSNKVSDVLTDKYKWYVPASSGSQSLAVVAVADGKLSSAGFSQGEPALLSKESLIKDVTAGSAGIGKITSITPAYSELYKTVFVFITSENGEFCIPYAQKEDEMGLDNGKVYKTDDMMKTLNKRFDESIYINNSDSDFGGLPYRQSGAPYAIILISAVSVTAIAVIGIYLFRTRKSKAK